MNSLKTKSNNYNLINDKAVAGVVINAVENDAWAVYVAWEWPGMATDKFFAIAHAIVDNTSFNLPQLIDHVADYGHDVTLSHSAKKLFPQLF